MATGLTPQESDVETRQPSKLRRIRPVPCASKLIAVAAIKTRRSISVVAIAATTTCIKPPPIGPLVVAPVTTPEARPTRAKSEIAVLRGPSVGARLGRPSFRVARPQVTVFLLTDPVGESTGHGPIKKDTPTAVRPYTEPTASNRPTNEAGLAPFRASTVITPGPVQEAPKSPTTPLASVRKNPNAMGAPADPVAAIRKSTSHAARAPRKDAKGALEAAVPYLPTPSRPLKSFLSQVLIQVTPVPPTPLAVAFQGPVIHLEAIL